MKCLVSKLFVLGASAVSAGLVIRETDGSTAACMAKDREHRVFIQTHLALVNVPCEDMCKKVGAYPNCQCPGFDGQPASEGDTRKCMDKYCQDPKTPCPTDAFVGCVKDATKGSLMQWDALLQRVNIGLGLFNLTRGAARVGSCQATDKMHRALIQTQLALFDVKCEDMCKRVGAYPHCECPGFEGQPVSESDSRTCIEKNCQDPRTPCPTDAFITCVKEFTKTSLLQWESLLERVVSNLGHMKSMVGVLSVLG